MQRDKLSPVSNEMSSLRWKRRALARRVRMSLPNGFSHGAQGLKPASRNKLSARLKPCPFAVPCRTLLRHLSVGGLRRRASWLLIVFFPFTSHVLADDLMAVASAFNSQA